MRFLFIGDYSNFHVNLARELRRRGCEVVVISSGSKCMDTERDIDLPRRPGIIGGLAYINRLFGLLPQLSGYDVVQLINPNFLELKPGKIRYFFKELRRRNKLVSLSVAGSDPMIVDSMCNSDKLRYSEYRVGKKLSPFAASEENDSQKWLTPLMKNYADYIYSNVDAAVSCLYEYHLAVEEKLGNKLEYIGIPIDTENIEFREPDITGKINLFVGIKSEMKLFKGTDILLELAQNLHNKFPEKCTLTVAENLPYNEYICKQREAHIVFDQIYSYTPATNALEAMAMGKTVVSGGEPEYYDFISEESLRPIINVVPHDTDIFERLSAIIKNPEILKEKATEGRKFVERHNDSSTVVDKYMKHITKILAKK